MDKTAIKNYAVDARRKLIDAVSRKANQLYIFEDEIKTLRPGSEVEQLKSDGIFLTPDQLLARKCLYEELLTENIPYKPDIFHRKMEEIAYTWFNRLIALRFMEVNDYLPSGIRILSSKDKGRKEPDALREADMLPYVNKARIAALRADTSFTAAEKLYRYILIAQCNALSEILPGMFQRTNDYTELLLPDNLYNTGGIVHDLVSAITEDNFSLKEQGQIEIIGWLYQYYTSEKKDEVFAALKKNVKLNKDTIPAATQLFTPEWIVKYMVENSLGRIFVGARIWGLGFSGTETERIAKEKEIADSFGWKYYIPEAEQTPEVRAALVESNPNPYPLNPKSLKLIDPCMGSGHILVYAFEVLFQIYESVGYSEREIPNLILQNNLFGLDICDRATQLAYFALMMKARSHNRRFFRQDSVPQPKVMAVPESRPDVIKAIGSVKYFGVSMDEAERTAAEDDSRYVVGLFEHGKEYGSLIQIDPDLDYDRLKRYLTDYPKCQLTFDDAAFVEHAEAFVSIFDAAVMLAQKYDVVVTNPPYMGSGGQSPNIVEFLKTNFPNTKTDTFSAFIERCSFYASKNGYIGMFTPYVWMFIKSYEKLRTEIYTQQTIKTLIQFEYSAFAEATVPVCSFVLTNRYISEKGFYFRLVEFRGGMEVQRQKYLEAIENPNCGYFFKSLSNEFMKVPGSPVVYWVKDFSIFNFPLLNESFISGGRNKTHNDAMYVRFHWEIISTSKKWILYYNGGYFRKYYGNELEVVDWSDTSKKIYASKGGLLRKDLWEREGICWNKITSNINGFIVKRSLGVHSSVAPSIFPIEGQNTINVLGFLNSCVGSYLLKLINPTLTTNVGDVLVMPFSSEFEMQNINGFVEENIAISRTDWDSFETSRDFKRHPLI